MGRSKRKASTYRADHKVNSSRSSGGMNGVAESISNIVSQIGSAVGSGIRSGASSAGIPISGGSSDRKPSKQEIARSIDKQYKKVMKTASSGKQRHRRDRSRTVSDTTAQQTKTAAEQIQERNDKIKTSADYRTQYEEPYTHRLRANQEKQDRERTIANTYHAKPEDSPMVNYAKTESIIRHQLKRQGEEELKKADKIAHDQGQYIPSIEKTKYRNRLDKKAGKIAAKSVAEQDSEARKAWNKEDHYKSLGDRISDIVLGSTEQSIGQYGKFIPEVMAQASEGKAGRSGTVAHRGGMDFRDRANPNHVDKLQAEADRIRRQQHLGSVGAGQAASKLIAKGTEKAEQGMQGLSGGGKFAAETLQGATQLAIDLGIGATGLGMAPMGLRAAGAEVDNAMKNGATRKQALVSGAASGGIEMLTERIGNMGAILQKGFGKGISDDVVDRLLGKIAQKAASQGLKDLTHVSGRWLTAAAEEGLEEVIAEAVEPGLANAIYDAGNATILSDPEQALADWAHAGALGGVLGGVAGGGGVVAQHRTGSNIRRAGMVDDMMARAVNVDDEADAATAQGLKAVVDSGQPLTSLQVEKLSSIVAKQQQANNEKMDDAVRAATTVMARHGYSAPQDDDIRIQRGEETALVAEDLIAAQHWGEDTAAVRQRSGEIADRMARLETGEFSNADVDTILSDPVQRTIYEQVTGVELPKAPSEARNAIYVRAADGLVAMAQTQTELDRNDAYQKLVKKKEGSFGAQGQGVHNRLFADLESRGVDSRDNDAVSDLEKAFEIMYNGGKNDYKFSELRNMFRDDPRFKNADVEFLNAAYNAGQADGKAQVRAAARRQAGILKADGNTKGRLITTNLSEENTPSIELRLTLESIARMTGNDIVLVDELKDGVEGSYENREIYISTSVKRPILSILSHEITHFIEDFAPEAWADLRDYAVSHADELYGVDINTLIENKIKQYANAGVKLEREGAIKEIIANTPKLYTDGSIIEDIVNANRPLGVRILMGIREALRKIRAAIAENSAADVRWLRADLEAVKQAERLWTEALAKAAENREGVSGGERLSLQEFEDGRRVVVVDQMQDVFDNADRSEYGAIAEKIIRERFAGKVIGVDNRMFVNGAGAKEFRYPTKHFADDLYNAKMRTAPELDNLLDAGTNFRNEPDGKDGHVHPDVVGGFDYFDTIFKIGDRYFEATINIKNVANGKLFKDVTNIKDVTQDTTDSYGENPKFGFLRTSSTDNVPDRRLSVKEDYATLTPERIDSIIEEYAIPGNDTSDYSKAWIATINPRDFLTLTVSDDVAAKWPEADLDTDELKSTRQMPYLTIDSSESNSVIGHEGRHRMLAMVNAGITESPVIIKDISESTKNNKQPMDTMDLWSQDFGSGPVNDTNEGMGADVDVYDLIPVNEKNRAEIERLYGGNTRVQFSIEEPVETSGDLIAVHNLYEDDIKNALELGGFPMPSIAVTNMPHDKYGDISLLFGSDTVDPEFFRANKIYGGDAYTPTFPEIRNKYNDKVLTGIRTKLEGILGLQPYQTTIADGLRIPSFDEDNVDNKLRSNDPFEAYRDDKAMQIAYLKNGKSFDVAIPTKAGTLRGEGRDFWEMLDDKMPELAHDDISGVDGVMEKYEPALRSVLHDYYGRKFAKLYERKPNAKRMYSEQMGYGEVDRFLRDLIKFRKEGIPETVDQDALDEILKASVDEEGYREWMNNLFDGVIEKRGIRNNKDLFTPSGNRRKWESLHDPVTLENVVRSMKEDLDAGSASMFGANPRGAAQKQYKNLDEVHADEGRLQMMDDEEYSALMEKALEKMESAARSIADHNETHSSYYGLGALDVGGYIAEVLNQTRDKAKMKRILTKEYNLKITDSEMDDVMDAIDAIAEVPTGYFEAKPKRAVGLDEVKAAIIPQSLSDDVKQQLVDHGIKTTEYNPDIEGDRAEKVNQAAEEGGLRFSIADESRVMYTPAGVEVVQNPTSSEYNDMRNAVLEEYPWLRGTGEPLLRHTYDEEGNQYYWDASSALHVQVEPYINRKWNTRTSQQYRWWEDDDKDYWPRDYSGMQFSIEDASESGDIKGARLSIDGENGIIPVDTIRETLQEKFYKDGGENLDIATEAIDNLQRLREADAEGGAGAQQNDVGEVRRGRRRSGAVQYSIGNSGINTVGRAISDQFINTGYVDLRGQTARSTQDIAEICQVFRDPRFETFRIIYVRNGKIVSSEGISSKIPGLSSITRKGEDFAGMVSRVQKKISRVKADQVFLLHNHPSGEVNPSRDDMNVTGNFEKNVPEFAGHVIIDHDKYCAFEKGYTYGTHDLKGQTSFDFMNMPSIDHPLLNEKVRSDSDLARIAKGMQTSSDVSAVVYISSSGKVRELQEISNAVISNDENFKGYIRNEMRRCGAKIVALCTEDGNILRNNADLIEEAYAVDIIALDRANNTFTSARDSGVSPGNYEWAGLTGSDIPSYTVSEDDVWSWLADNSEDLVGPDNDMSEVPVYDQMINLSRARRVASMEELSEAAKWIRKENETKLTHGRRLDARSVKEQMNVLIRELMVNSDSSARTKNAAVKQAVAAAQAIYPHLLNEDYDAAANIAYDVALDIIEQIDIVNDEMYMTYAELRDYFRTTKIWIPEQERGSDYNDLRKKNVGRLRISNSGIELDKIWYELCGDFPGIFDPETNGMDRLAEIDSVLDSFSDFHEEYTSQEMDELASLTAGEIMNIAYEGKPERTFADKKKEVYDRRTKALKERHREAMAAYREKEKARREKAVKEEREKKKAAVAKEKARGEEKLRQQKEKQKQAKARKKENDAKRKALRAIEREVSWLSTRLISPTDDKHIPEGYRQAVAQLLAALDTQTERSRKLEEKYGVSKKQFAWRQLKDKYKEIAESESYGFVLDEGLVSMMEQLADYLDDKQLSNANSEQLDLIKKIVKGIRHGIAYQNKAFSDAIKEQTDALGRQTMEDTEEKINKHGGRDGRARADWWFLNESMATPRDYFEGIGSGMNVAFMALRAGMDTHVRDVDFIRSTFTDIFGKYAKKKKPGSELEKWRDDTLSKEFTLESGETIKLNPSQIMSLYCLMQRKQAIGHILGSGIIASDVSTKQKLKEKVRGKAKATRGRRVTVTLGDITQIVETLTEDQREMATKMQDLLNGPIAEWGNETSMKMNGYKKFEEEKYFPIQVEKTYLSTDFDVTKAAERVKNPNFSKSTVQGASNPIVIADIFSVVADHCNAMSMYRSFAPAIADFQRVYNHVERDENGLMVGSVKESLKAAYGQHALEYIETFMTDLNGTTPKSKEALTSFVTKSLANYKKAAIGFNLRVAVQQPTAIIRAMVLINPKYFAAPKNPKRAIEEMKEHCPIALWKSWGFSQVDMARSMEEIMMNQEWSRTDVITMQAYGALDTLTWSQIWGAVKREVKAKNPDVEYESQEFWDLCNERASEVFDKTQVVDSVFHRSQVMRSNGALEKLMTSFMAEPTRTFNMVWSQMREAKFLWKDGQKGKATAKANRALSVYIANAALVSMAAAVADALRGKGAGDGDDDDKGWSNLYWSNFIQNFIDNANPLGLMPLAKDVVSMVEIKWDDEEGLQIERGYGTQFMALEGLEKLMYAFADWTNDKKSLGEKVRATLEGAGYVFGIPASNVFREFDWMMNRLGALFATEKGEDGSDNFVVKLTEKAKEIYNIKLGGDKKSDDKSDGEEPAEDGTKYKSGKYADVYDEIEQKTEGLSGYERQDKIWDIVTDGYTSLCTRGDYKSLKKMRKILEKTGGDVNKFDEAVLKWSKSGLKKNISDSIDYGAVDRITNYLTSNGLSKDDISEVVKDSDAAKGFQKALQDGDKEAERKYRYQLIAAGLTFKDVEELTNKAYKKGTGTFQSPIAGDYTITSHFGARSAPTRGASSYHPAIDIGVPVGTPVCAADSGKVVYTGSNGGYGISVGVDHGNGYVTYYNHLSGYGVKKGDYVRKGQEIAKSGNTGTSTGPHLDFKILKDGKAVDPEQFIR